MSGPSGIPAPRLSRIKSIYVKAEAAFNVNAGGWGGTTGPAPAINDRLEAEDIMADMGEGFAERTAQLQRLGQITGVVLGKNAKIKFKVPLRGCKTTGAGGATADTGLALAAVLQASMLVRTQQIGEPLTAGSSGNTDGNLLVDAGTAATGNFGVVGAPVVALADAAQTLPLQVRGVPVCPLALADTVIGDPWFSRAGTDDTDILQGADVWAMPTDATLAGSTGGAGTSVSILANGDGFSYLCTGCTSAPPKITATANKRVFLEFEFEITDYEFTTTMTYAVHATFDQFPANLPPGIVAIGSQFMYGGGALAPTQLLTDEVIFDWGMGVKEIPSTSGPNGRYGFMPTQGKPTMKIKPYYDPGWISDYEGTTERLALFQLGSTPGSCAAIFMPASQIIKYPGAVDRSGILGQDIELEGHLPSQLGNAGAGDVALAGLAPAYLAIY